MRKYDVNGIEQWTRQFGTNSLDEATAAAVDATGLYVAGFTAGALPGQTSGSLGQDDAFVRKYDLNGNELWTRQFGTSSGDQAYGVATTSGSIYVVGTTNGSLVGPNAAKDGFLRKYDGNGTVVWTRQFSSAGSNQDEGFAVGADASGIYVGGDTTGTFAGQTRGGDVWDAYAKKFNADGVEQWTRQIGTDRNDHAFGIAVGALGVFVVGNTFGVLPGQTSFRLLDAYVRRYDFNGTETGTRQFGINSNDEAYGVAADGTGVYVCGYFAPNPPGPADAFVLRIPPPPDVSVGGVVNNASFAPSPAAVAPGSIAAVFGSNLNDGSSVLFSDFGPDGRLLTSLGGTSVTINNIPAPMFYSTLGQLGVQIPFEVAGQTSATIQVTVAGQTSVSRTINLDAVAPGIFTANQQGTGIAAVLHEDGVTPVTAQNPARPNEVVVFFATGLGALTPALATGAPSVGNQTVTAATVTIDGVQAEVQFSGAAPGFVGLNQINLRIPPNTRAASNIPVVLTVGGKQSNPVTIPVAP